MSHVDSVNTDLGKYKTKQNSPTRSLEALVARQKLACSNNEEEGRKGKEDDAGHDRRQEKRMPKR